MSFEKGLESHNQPEVSEYTKEIADKIKDLASELHKHKETVAHAINTPTREMSHFYQDSASKYEAIRAQILPELKDKIIGLVEKSSQEDYESNRQAVKAAFFKLKSCGETEISADIMLDESLSFESNLKLAVEYINVFGFVQAIDAISSRLKQNPDDENLKRLYKTLQGEEVETVMEDLTKIYSEINFQEYAINNQELTKAESDIVEDAVDRFLYRKGLVGQKDKKSVRVLDDGAGTGRHALELASRGYERVIAMDYEQKHVDLIKAAEHGDELEVVRGDWHNLPFKRGVMNKMEALEQRGRSYKGARIGESDDDYLARVKSEHKDLLDSYEREDAIEVFYCLGRSILHNRTPSDMIRWFDEVSRVTARDAVGVIDIPDVDVGSYGENLNKFRQNLEELGVEKMHSHLLFDGPDNAHKFNRMVMDETQMHAYARLTGFKVVDVESREISGGDVKNLYFTLEKDRDFDPRDIEYEEMMMLLKEVGLLDGGVDFNMYIEAWQMTLGQAVLVGLSGRASEKLRNRNLIGHKAEVVSDINVNDGMIELSLN